VLCVFLRSLPSTSFAFLHLANYLSELACQFPVIETQLAILHCLFELCKLFYGGPDRLEGSMEVLDAHKVGHEFERL